jgi:hypothetical protein
VTLTASQSSIGAPFAFLLTIMLSLAQSISKYAIVTPYSVSSFSQFFAQFPHIQHCFPNLLQHLSFGFPMGHFSSLNHHIILPNRKSSNPNIIEQYLAQEVGAGHMFLPQVKQELTNLTSAWTCQLDNHLSICLQTQLFPSHNTNRFKRLN